MANDWKFYKDATFEALIGPFLFAALRFTVFFPNRKQ
jgi:hypothetical protein